MSKQKNYRINKAKLVRAVLLMSFVVAAIVLTIVGLGNGCMQGNSTNSESDPTSNTQLMSKGVIIDAGHGGTDPGAISTVTGAHEDDINLSIAQLLRDELESYGIPVIMTRSDENAIAETKDADMEKRREIIHGSSVCATISIHMNSFPDDPTVWGPQTHYQEGDGSSKELAYSIQTSLNKLSGGSRGIYEDRLYVLNGNPMPSVLIECGFLSNSDEATRLLDSDYQRQLAEAIVSGLFDYFG